MTLASRDFADEVLRRLTSVENVESIALADLFRYAGGEQEYAVALRRVLQVFLLGRTLTHARRHTKYYHNSDYPEQESIPTSSSCEPILDGIPLLRREAVADRLDEFLAEGVELHSVNHTSGTTGTPLSIHRSHEEIRFVREYYMRLFRPVALALKSRPLIMSLPNLYHGTPVPMPSIGMSFVGGVTDNTLIQDARRMLEREYRLKGYDSRISVLSGLPHHVLLLTTYLIEQGIDPRDFMLSGITVTGGYVATNSIRYLEESWGCPIHDRFTLTEAIGGASRLPGTDVFQLDPHILGEVVEPDSGRQIVEGGVGLLALTNLHPFVQMQPLVRYCVGDVVRRVPGSGPLKFQFLGKEKNCISWVRDGRREWLLFSARLNELANIFPDCNYNQWYSNMDVVNDKSVGLLPFLAATGTREADRLVINVGIELRYTPSRWPTRVDHLQQIVVAGLRDTPNSALAARMDSGEVQLNVRFVGPGALKAPLVLKI